MGIWIMMMDRRVVLKVKGSAFFFREKKGSCPTDWGESSERC